MSNEDELSIPDPATVELLAAEHVDWAGGPLSDPLPSLLCHAIARIVSRD